MDIAALLPPALLGAILAAMCVQLIQEYASDIRAARTQLQPKKNSAKPTISVIVQTSNDARSISASLASVFKSSYHRHRVTVVDNASDDMTLDTVKRFQKRYPKRLERVVRRRSRDPLPWKKLISRYAHGDIVLIMTSPHVLDSKTLEHIAHQFSVNPPVGRMALRIQHAADSQLKKIYLDYADIWQNLVHKRLSDRRMIAPERGSVFAVRKSRPSRPAAVYNSRALALRLNTHRPAGELHARLLPILFCVTFIYTIITLDSVIFLYGWSLFTAFSLLSIGGDTGLSRRQKIRKLQHLIPAYVIFCSYQIVYSGKALLNRIRRSLQDRSYHQLTDERA